MILCCKIMRCGIAASVSDFRRFVDVAATLEYEDVWPRELAKAIERSSLDGIAAATRAQLISLAEQLDRAAKHGSWFRDLLAER